VRSKTPPRTIPMQLSRAQCTPLSATPHRCRKAAKVLTRVVQSFAMLSRLKPLLMHCGPPDSIVSVLVRAPIRYAGHAKSKSDLITLLLQSPGALLWHRPAPEDVDYASGALCYSQCRSSIISCPKDSCKDSKGASQELVFEILHRSTV
jgi:hypothetical protein